MKEFNFNSEVFNNARLALDAQIQNVIDKLYAGEFDNGKVSLNLEIDLLKKEEGDKYNIPVVNYNANHTLKHESKCKGLDIAKSAVKKDEESGIYIETPIEDLSLLEEDE